MKNKECLKKRYKLPTLKNLGKLTYATKGGNSSCADGPQSSQQCTSGRN